MRRKKQAMSVVCCLALTAVGLILAPSAANGATANDFDLDQALRIAELSAFTAIDTSGVTAANVATNPAILAVSGAQSQTVMTNTLTNRTGIQQQLTSSRANHTVEEWVRTSNAAVHKAGGALSGETSFDFQVALAPGETVTWRGSWSWNELVVSRSASVAVTSPQRVIVAPNTTVKVTAVQNYARFSGDITRQADLQGAVRLRTACATIEVTIGKLLSLKRNNGMTVAPAGVAPNGDHVRVTTTSRVDGTIATSADIFVEEVKSDGSRGRVLKIGSSTGGNQSVVPKETKSSVAPKAKAMLAAVANAKTFTELAEVAACVRSK